MTYSKEQFEKETRPLAEELLKYTQDNGTKYNITDAKIQIAVGQKQKNSIEEGEVAEVSSGKSIEISVVLFSGAKKMSFTKNTFDLDTLKKAIDDNMHAIHLVPENPDQKLLEEDKVFKGTEEDLETFDRGNTSQEQLIDYAKDIEAKAAAFDKIKSTRETSITHNLAHILTLATNGIDKVDSKTNYFAMTSAIAEDENGMEVSYEGAMARNFRDMPAPEVIGEHAAKGAIAKLSPKLPNKGSMPIVLSHDAAEAFFNVVFSAIDGGAVYRGLTFLKDKIGEQVMSNEVTLVDDPRIKRGLRSSFTDSSGMESKAITFIENGILKSYNVGLEEARQLGIDPIGRNNGPTNSSILPGKLSVEELIQDIKEGIYIEDFKGGKADVNNGIHSREGNGRMIRDGKITDEAVSGFVVAGNLKEMFMNVTLANDTPEQPSTRHQLVAPTTRINGVTISSNN